MKMSLSFKFVNDDFNGKLIKLVQKAKIEHVVDETGVIHYLPDDEERVENELICSVRNEIFDAWQVLTCPRDWADRYKQYMSGHNVPFQEELINNEIWFLIPRKHRPHLWKMDAGKLRKKAEVGT